MKNFEQNLHPIFLALVLRVTYVDQLKNEYSITPFQCHKTIKELIN